MGARAVSPAESTAVQNPLVGVAKELGSIFVQGLQGRRKAEAEKQENDYVNNYVREQTVINQAFATGQLDATRANAQSRILFDKYSGNAQYLESITKAAKSLRDFGGKSAIQDEVQSLAEITKKRDDKARELGIPVLPTMNEEEKELARRTAEQEVRAQQQFAQAEARAESERKTYRFGAEVEAERKKRDSTKLVTEMASGRVEAFSSYVNALGRAVREGKLDSKAAEQQLALEFAKIESSIQAAGTYAPELATQYRSIFSGLNQLGKDLVSTKGQVADAEDQFKLRVAQAKLLATDNPEVLGTFIAGALFPNAVDVALRARPQVLDVIARVVKGSQTEGGFTPTVIGDAETEKASFEIIKKTIEASRTSTGTSKEAALTEAGKFTNVLLRQVGDTLRNGKATGKELAQAAAFIQYPEFGELVISGKIDGDALKSADAAFQVNFREKVLPLVTQKLYGETQFTPLGTNKDKVPLKVKPIDYVTFVPTEAGVTVSVKPQTGKDAVANKLAADYAARIASEIQPVVNQLIRSGAHLEGTKNYKGYWEQNKHMMFPQVFPAPKDTGQKFGTEAGMKAAVDGADTGKGVTADALSGLLKDFDKLSAEQKKQLETALKQIRGE
jgi:hypothetical protein